jgi:hypothetical protein
MRTWIRQKLLNILLDADSGLGSRSRISVSLGDCDVMESDPSIDLPDPIRFRVQQVSGGTVIETKYYDHKKDEERVKLHIVTPEENLSESIGKIVTMELLQK